jgi:aminopeptidase N
MMKKIRFAYLLLSAALLLIPLSLSPALDRTLTGGDDHYQFQWVDPAHTPRGPMTASAQQRALIVTPQAIDVEHYRLQLRLFPPTRRIAGVVTIEGQTVDAITAINIDVQSNLAVDSVQLNGADRVAERTDDKIILHFPESLPAGFHFTIVVAYHGIAITSGVLGGGMLTSTHGNNVPVIATLSEPYAAPTWWPCVDNPADKTTAEIEATVPDGYVVASNGLLQGTQSNADQTVTYFWRENYPIANYLIAVTATNFVRFEDTYTALDGVTTMPLVYYVYPEHLTVAQQTFSVTRRAMEIFAPLFGEYPFLEEKYGMVEFPWCGGMEHQTLTSLGSCLVGNSSPRTLVHELSHQWWGDWVTMKTWHDIWLNEGFATYCEVLFFERFLPIAPGELMDRSYDDHQVFGRLGGTVYAEDLTNPWDDSGAIYTKGGWVLHMLRRVLGDERFFAALQDYGRRFAFGNASTADFQRVCEDHYGAPLDWFFQQWIYAPARPIYQASSTISSTEASGSYTVTLTLEQQQSHTIPGRAGELAQVYIMPLDITIHYADGSQETQVVWNRARQQAFSFTVSKPPVRVGLDEGRWVLKELRMN